MSLQVLYSILNHPNQLQNSMRMADYLISESDRLLNEILNSLKINQNKLRKLFKGFIDRHSKRLWRLYLTRAEVCFKAEDLTLETSYLLRVIINNVSGELHNSNWVVMDPTINDDMMEMYADKKARAGVLEPKGIVEIKFKKPQLLTTIENIP
ncbi:18646_t:CDS:2, partial [Funneliformis geosporum]